MQRQFHCRLMNHHCLPGTVLILTLEVLHPEKSLSHRQTLQLSILDFQVMSPYIPSVNIILSLWDNTVKYGLYFYGLTETIESLKVFPFNEVLSFPGL